jgi:hypothetical protein
VRSERVEDLVGALLFLVAPTSDFVKVERRS